MHIPQPYDKKSIENSLKYSIYDGFFYSLMVGFGETYFSAYALFLSANNFQMGILTCLPPFLAGLCQFYTFKIQKKFQSRKKIVCTGVFLQTLSFAPILLTNHFENLRMEFYIFFVTFYFASNNTISPIWNSWMGDLVDSAKRGLYFGQRNRVIMVGTFLSMVIAGLTLNQFKGHHFELWGFYHIFILALGSRFVSFLFLTNKVEPYSPTGDLVKIPFFKFCKELPQKNYGNLILSMILVNFAVYVAAAYYTPHMLKNMKLNYFTYTVMISAVLLFKSLSSRFWGEVTDKIGAKKVVVYTSFLIGITTWPWILTQNIYVLFLAQCYTGFVWAGYELSTFTFLLDATHTNERTQVSSYFNILNTTAGFLGGLAGAIFVSKNADVIFAFKVLFFTTSTLRLTSFFIFKGRLKETRIIQTVKTKDVILKASGFKSTMGLTSRLVIFNKKK